VKKINKKGKKEKKKRKGKATMTAPSPLSPCCSAFSTHFIIDAPGKCCNVMASVGIKTEK